MIQSETTIAEKPQILDLLKKDIEAKHLAELEDYFKGELRGFTAINLVINYSDFDSDSDESDDSIINLKDILLAIENYQVAIIFGEAGCGKTSLTK